MDVEGLNDGVGSSGVARDRLKTFFEHIERLEEQKAALIADVSEILPKQKAKDLTKK